MHSSARPTRLVATLILTAWLAACHSDPIAGSLPPDQPGYRSLSVQDEAALGVTATGMMAAIGCAPGAGAPDTASVVLSLLPGLIKVYRCAGVDRDTVLATAKAVQAVVAANPAGASAQSELGDGGGGSPYLEYSHTECVWQAAEPTEYGTRPGAPGELPEVFVKVSAQPGYCAWLAIFKYVVPVGGGVATGTDPSGGPGGPGIPTLPTGDPLASDSVWTEEDECEHLAPGCLVKLDDRQGRYFMKALALTDTTHEICRTALAAMRDALSAGKVFIGHDSLQDAPRSGHSAQTLVTTNRMTGIQTFVSMHVDQDVYKLVKTLGRDGVEAFARLLLHEAMHVLHFVHPANDGQEPPGVYRPAPFDTFNAGSALNGCLRP